MTVRATDGSETLLKHALPVPDGSAEPKARLTRRQVPLAVRQLRDFNSRARGAAVTALDSTPRSQLINYLIIFFFGRAGACHSCHSCHFGKLLGKVQKRTRFGAFFEPYRRASRNDRNDKNDKLQPARKKNK